MLTINTVQHFIDNIIEAEEANQLDSNLSIDELKHLLELLPLKPGSVILLLFNNSKLFIKYVFATLLAGYVPALIPPSTPLIRLNAIAKVFNAKALVKGRIRGEAIVNLSYIINLDHSDIALLNNDEEVSSYPGELILTTSGTSGFSTGCVFDFSSLLKNAEKHANVTGIHDSDRVLVNLPLYYSYAFVAQALATYVRNATLVISSPPFNCNVFEDTLNKYSISYNSLTPLLVKEIQGKNIVLPPSVRAITVGGDTLDSPKIEKFLKKYPNKELYITYGITEAGPRVATLAAHKEPAHRLKSVGTLLPDTFSLFDGDELTTQGELLIHSDTLVKRRLGNSSKPLFVPIAEKLWLRTGDIFSIDADGYLYYKSRLSDFIILNGEKVNLGDIKRLISATDDVLSTKITLTKNHNDELTGYNLDLVVNHEYNQSLEKLRSTLQQNLKFFERPKEIFITKFGENNSDRYK